MIELALELSKRLSLKGDANNSSIFGYFLLGPLLLAGTLALVILKLYLSSEFNSAWVVACILSFTCSVLITALSFREGSSLLSAESEQLHEKEESILKLQQHIEEMKAIALQEKEQAKNSLESVLSQLKEAEKRAESIEDLLAVKKYEWEALEEEKEILFQEKVSLKQDFDQLVAESAQIADRANPLQEVPKPAQEVAPSPHPYDELRKQFDEKSAVLNETRKELFAFEGKYLTLQKEMENSLLEPSREIQDLLNHCSELEIYCNRLEEDLKNHQELLTEISVKKTVRKASKTPSKRVKVDETVVADLFTEPSKKAKVIPK